MQATWCDTNFEESGFITSKDAGYDHDDFLASIASMKSMHDSDVDDEITDD